MIHATSACGKALSFLLLNSIAYLWTPPLCRSQLGENDIIPYQARYRQDVIDLWTIDGDFSPTYKLFLAFLGRKFCFLLVDRNNRLLGFICFYYRFRDLGKRHIHAAFKIIAPEERGKGYASLLHRTAFATFRRSRWIHGVSATYAVNNEVSRKSMQNYGYRVVRRYFEHGSGTEKEDAVYDFTYNLQ